MTERAVRSAQVVRSDVHGFLVSECNDEVVAEIGEDGNGTVTVTDHANDATSSSACTRVACNGVGESGSEADWPIGDAAQLDDSIAHAYIGLCLDSESSPNSTGFHCTPEVEISSPAEGQLVLQEENFACGSAIELTIRLATEAEPESSDAVSLGLLRVFRPASPQLDFTGVTMRTMTFTNHSKFRITTETYLPIQGGRFGASNECENKTIQGNTPCTIEVTKNAAGGETNLYIPYMQFTSSGEARLHLIN
ncbi:MAG TPA: hypothetical protein VHF90_02410 [Thermoleophilaceae bacterium]|nr:hypothetical protein [Thermoleophilaceae bacterium]